ncbi:MAG TPA: hypothetical protein VMT62_07040 [Syntrophorhabdaceae bacterium]|nr:hypothetical protein [Syntrophorhabdaceae bacterium]
MNMAMSRCRILICILLIMLVAIPLYAKDDKINPKEPGAYIKTSQGLKRLLPNIVFDEEGLIYVEANNPVHFLLKDVQYFVFSGKYDFKVLTLNPMRFLGPSPLGKPRLAFGKNVDFDIKQIGPDLYTIKPKGLLGRGYFSLWINETAWDFILD